MELVARAILGADVYLNRRGTIDGDRESDPLAIARGNLRDNPPPLDVETLRGRRLTGVSHTLVQIEPVRRDVEPVSDNQQNDGDLRDDERGEKPALERAWKRLDHRKARTSKARAR